MSENLDFRHREDPSRSGRSGALKKPYPYFTLVSETGGGGAYIRTPGREVVLARRVEDDIYEFTFMLRSPIRVRVLKPEDKWRVSCVRTRLQSVLLEESLSHLSGCLPLEIPEFALPELEALTPSDRFFHLSPGEGDCPSENVLGLPTRVIEVSGRPGITQIPAFRVDVTQGGFVVNFGHLRQDPGLSSGWVIYNHGGLMQVNGSTYFRN